MSDSENHNPVGGATGRPIDRQTVRGLFVGRR
jgi:hypothetical protein